MSWIGLRVTEIWFWREHFFYANLKQMLIHSKEGFEIFLNRGLQPVYRKMNVLFFSFFCLFIILSIHLIKLYPKMSKKCCFMHLDLNYEGIYENYINLQKIDFFPSSEILFDRNVDFFLLLNPVLLLNYEKKSEIYG